MNSYQNPYYMGVGQVPPYNYPYTMAQQPLNSNNQTMKQMINYDFQGNYVKSYEEAKNAPYTDKPTVYLDTENDKIYIKRINEKGSPETNVYLIKPSTEEQKTTKENFKREFEELKSKYEERISYLEEQLKQITSAKGGD